MMSTNRYYAVDQLKGRVAVLIDEENHQIAVPLNRLPKNTRQGSRLAVPLDPSGTPNWSDAVIAPADSDRSTETAGAEPQKSTEAETHTQS